MDPLRFLLNLAKYKYCLLSYRLKAVRPKCNHGLKGKCSLCLYFKKDDNVDSNNNIVSAIIDCNLATKIQYSIIRSIKYSWLNLDSEEWFINIEGMGDLAAFAINDILDMAKQICNIYELGKIPETYIRTDENNFCIDDKITIINEIPDKKVLDFGCGGGYLLDKINCKKKFGVEINNIAIKEAEKNKDY